MSTLPNFTSLSAELKNRLVRYSELRPCVNAFIDARSPGSDKKENFTIIGPGVAENPNQYVHVREPHGFNIGGARQPPGCTNSLHSHDSEEVFIIHRGTWRFFWGEHGDAGEVMMYPGDTISIPIHIFRGFENVGQDVGFMFAVLGGDDPGRVHWAPHVLEKARGFGLLLLEDGSLVDTTLGERAPHGAVVVKPSSRTEVAYIRTPGMAEMEKCVVSHDALHANIASPLAMPGVREAAIIGAVVTSDGFTAAPISSPHGFTLRQLQLDRGAKTPLHAREVVEVLLVQRGRVMWRNDVGDEIELAVGDTFSIPPGMPRELEGIDATEIFVVRGGDDPGVVHITEN
jgi:quercetin dioxygenase-like cupin family protein